MNVLNVLHVRILLILPLHILVVALRRCTGHVWTFSHAYGAFSSFTQLFTFFQAILLLHGVICIAISTNLEALLRNLDNVQRSFCEFPTGEPSSILWNSHIV